MATGSLSWLPNAGRIMLDTVDHVVSHRWDAAVRRAEETAGSRSARVAQLKRSFARELSTVGAAAGAVAAVPGPGTAVAIGTDLSWLTLRSADLILTIAAVHGHREPSVEERRAWVLSILAFGDAAAATLSKLASEPGRAAGVRATARLPVQILRRVNKSIGRKILTKYGTRRGALALSKALPAGIGATIGGGTNYLVARSIARQADKFFLQLDADLQTKTAG